jgi:hypothetical protein
METYQIVGIVILLILMIIGIVALAIFAPRYTKDGSPVKPISPFPHNDRQ